MANECLLVEHSPALKGTVALEGAKNAVLVSMTSTILAPGVSVLTNVPLSSDVFQMIQILEDLGASVAFDVDAKQLTIDTTNVEPRAISPEIMRKMRASILVMGPLLARFGRVQVALPGGCLLGARPIDFHLRAFAKMGARIEVAGEFLCAQATSLTAQTFVLEYPSVGATENIMMAAVLTPGVTRILNAAIEPEVLNLIEILEKMGASIKIEVPGTVVIEGVTSLRPITHAIIPDRLEAGTLLLAAAVTQGEVTVLGTPVQYLDVFFEKLVEMGHSVTIEGNDVTLRATAMPKAVSFRTMPYPGFPTDLQAPMMVAQTIACGTSVIYETVFENRLVHVRELQKMGAQITTDGPLIATVKGVEHLYGAQVIAPDLRASAALVLAGLVAQGQTVVSGIHHFRRGYAGLDEKLRALGAKISVVNEDQIIRPASSCCSTQSTTY